MSRAQHSSYDRAICFSIQSALDGVRDGKMAHLERAERVARPLAKGFPRQLRVSSVLGKHREATAKRVEHGVLPPRFLPCNSCPWFQDTRKLRRRERVFDEVVQHSPTNAGVELGVAVGQALRTRC